MRHLSRELGKFRRVSSKILDPCVCAVIFVVENILKEACRSDIQENRRLNYHLYEALRKSVYKPAAFYKGMLLPLASAGDCTLREAAIFASVLSRVRGRVFFFGVLL